MRQEKIQPDPPKPITHRRWRLTSDESQLAWPIPDQTCDTVSTTRRGQLKVPIELRIGYQRVPTAHLLAHSGGS